MKPSATRTGLGRERPRLILWTTRKIAPANSAAFLAVICRSTSGSMNRRPSWQMFGIAPCATIRKESFLAERIFDVAIRNSEGKDLPVCYIGDDPQLGSESDARYFEARNSKLSGL